MPMQCPHAPRNLGIFSNTRFPRARDRERTRTRARAAHHFRLEIRRATGAIRRITRTFDGGLRQVLQVCLFSPELSRRTPSLQPVSTVGRRHVSGQAYTPYVTVSAALANLLRKVPGFAPASNATMVKPAVIYSTVGSVNPVFPGTCSMNGSSSRRSKQRKAARDKRYLPFASRPPSKAAGSSGPPGRLRGFSAGRKPDAAQRFCLCCRHQKTARCRSRA